MMGIGVCGCGRCGGYVGLVCGVGIFSGYGERVFVGWFLFCWGWFVCLVLVGG